MTIALFAAIVFLAFAIEATAGFGATVVTVTLAAQLMPVERALGTFVPVNVLLSAYLLLRHRGAVDGRYLLRRVLPFMGAGVAGGIALFQLRGHGFLRIAFAAFVVILAASQLWPRRAAAPAAPLAPALARAGLVLAGVIHGLFACGGPLAVYVVGREIEDKTRFRTTLSALWLVFNAVLIPMYALEGQIDAASVRISALLIAPLLLGIVVGERLHDRLSPDKFRFGINMLLLAAGIALLVRSIST